jgi:transcriptional regulator with XRE-family HTH domain
MRVRYLGHPDGCDLPLPDGNATEVAYQQVIQVDDAFGQQLIEQIGVWEQADDAELGPERDPVEVVTPAQVFGRSLKQLREQRGWRLVDLAVRVSVVGHEMTRNRLSNLETGSSRRGVTLDELAAIAYAANVAPTRLLEGAFLSDPLHVAITERKTTTLFGYRSWLRGRQALRTDVEQYRLGVADEDYLELQRTTLRLLDQDIAQLIDTANSFCDNPTDDTTRNQLADAIDRVAARQQQLRTSDNNFPTERPRRQERRGRPRQAGNSQL